MAFYLPLFIVCLFFFFTRHPQPAFEAQTIDNNISIGYGLAIGDVDGDKKPDILLADKKQFVWYRNGDWKRFVMVDNLTEHDNVCIAARDLDGDGKVEVAVGAQWNPGETTNAEQSGSVHYLIRPSDPTQLWKPIELHHEPTVHRMRWVKELNGKNYLVVVPLHGRGNKGGEGEGVRTLAYEYPKNVNGSWRIDTLEKSMHLTHNFDVIESKNNNKLYLGGKEGITIVQDERGKWLPGKMQKLSGMERGVGEIRIGSWAPAKEFITTIEPMHGDEVVVYLPGESKRVVIDNNVKEGHGLAVADLLGAGSDQVVAGWRVPNKEGKVGIKLYTKKDANGEQWTAQWIDDNGMACEDLKIADLNGDGKPDVIAAGRATHNLKVYWNK
ncbi:MAG: VCBS repeat-containing protein [Flavisolibacter sp.]|nr:VCBS repeat-containing protein [Flavisolibacter sp.]